MNLNAKDLTHFKKPTWSKDKHFITQNALIMPQFSKWSQSETLYKMETSNWSLRVIKSHWTNNSYSSTDVMKSKQTVKVGGIVYMCDAKR